MLLLLPAAVNPASGRTSAAFMYTFFC